MTENRKVRETNSFWFLSKQRRAADKGENIHMLSQTILLRILSIHFLTNLFFFAIEHMPQ